MKTQALARLKALAFGEGMDDPTKMLEGLSGGLESILVPYQHRELPFENKGFKGVVRVGKPGKTVPIAKLLKGLDFVLTSKPFVGSLEGVRDDREGRTYVYYNAITGVTVVNSSLPAIQL